MKINNKSQFTKTSIMILIVLFLLVSLVFPVGMLFEKAFYNNNNSWGIGNFIEYFKTPSLVSSIYNSFFVGIFTTLIVILAAFFYAYSIERTNIKFKSFLRLIAFFPLFAPTMTHGLALIYLFGNKGIITTGFFGKLPQLAFHFPLYGKWGIIIAEFIYAFPIAFIMFTTAFKMTDGRLYEAAEILGSNRLKQFFTITIPGLKFTIISAVFAVFTMVFTDFGAPKVIGGNYNLLSTDIFKQVIGQHNITMGSTVGILLIIPSIIAFIAEQIANRRSSTIDSKAKPYVIKKNPVRDKIYMIYNFIIAFFILSIFITILFAAFVKKWPYDLSLTLKWFKIKTFGMTPLDIYIDTLIVSFISALIGTVIVLITSYLCERSDGFKFVKKILRFLSIISLALPGLVIGLSFITFFNQRGNPLNIIYGTFVIIIIANIIHFYSVPYLTITSNMKKIDKEYENAAELMGIPWYKVFIDVIIPSSLSAIIESFSYYFVNSMMTISAVIFLYTSQTKLAAVEMINRFDTGDISSSAAIAVLIIITNIVFNYIFKNIALKISNRN